MSERADYVIVGGGPAGLAVGIFAALAGRRAVVVERREGDVDKACGEGVMPPGVAWLRRMGVDLGAGGAWPFRGIRYVDGDTVAEAEFVDGPGLGIRRTALSGAMRARAAALGVEVRQGCEAGAVVQHADHVALTTAEDELRARWLVVADGLHGRVGRACGFRVRAGRRRRIGLRRHFRVAPWADFVEVHWADDVEAYVTPVGPECVGIAFLCSAEPGRRSDYPGFLARFPDLRARLGPAVAAPSSGLRGGGPFDVRVDSIARGRVLLVGDASGYVDAITGEGLSIAFASAAALVDATRGGHARAYPAAWRRLRRQHAALTRLLLWIAERPRLRRRVVKALARRPAAFQAFLALNTGAWGWTRALPRALGLGVELIGQGAGGRG